MPWNDCTSNEIQCKGKEAQIISRTRSRSGGRRVPSADRSKASEVIFEDGKTSPEHESSRCLRRISNSGYAYSCPDVTFPLGFTKDECEILATRQRATNYLFHMYTDRGRPYNQRRERS
ncbi:hypothetical protein OS493_021027 [Desmophyllum pertusum]|uniref:Uncharacterized protein n=1 Tax=Desmophyllum pertusum TaxID=174260 RepID=A0A9X0A095_9CNID|nr:hypothetical protein OS493_021027 [Desmophyllum pertusum]